MSSYRTTFTVPENWKGRDVILRFDGVYSACYVWVNGEKVGYAEDSKLPSDYRSATIAVEGADGAEAKLYDAEKKLVGTLPQHVHGQGQVRQVQGRQPPRGESGERTRHHVRRHGFMIIVR